VRRLTLSEAIAEAGSLRQILAGGGVLGIPTDTLYGLAASPFSERGVSRIYELKGRPAEKAMPVLVSSVDDLPLLGVEDGPFVSRLRGIWPAPLTVVLAVRSPFPAASAQLSVAVRVPAHAELRRLLGTTGPVTATSANRAGQPPATTADEVAAVFGEDLDILIDGGPAKSVIPSTLLDAVNSPPRVLRMGAFDWPISDLC